MTEKYDILYYKLGTGTGTVFRETFYQKFLLHFQINLICLNKRT
jgi:hypothetical protein